MLVGIMLTIYVFYIQLYTQILSQIFQIQFAFKQNNK